MNVVIKPKSKIYKIPVSWTVTATMEIEAESLAEACEKADEMSLPSDESEYLDGSFGVDKDMLYAVNDDPALEQEIADYIDDREVIEQEIADGEHS